MILTEKKNLFSICMLGGTFQEYLLQPRLHSKFEWVTVERHAADRKKLRLRLQQHEVELIKKNKQFVADGFAELELGCSPFDIECLVTAMVKGFILVSDDLDLVALAKEYECPVLSTIQLLGLLYENSQVTQQEVIDIIEMWLWLEDVPSTWKNDYKNAFGEVFPDD
ncbi:MAG: hypothetical protein PF495_03580 [Spirochaetales bacterium]|jgi:predicted nuclease of predicted toxin-antitoxin system|nr:hypothetical protein [Spirochaetales bacterium]